MRIEILFDTTCPWCFLGKHRLESALRQQTEIRTKLIWHPFVINPDIPAQGLDMDEFLKLKFGSLKRSNQIHYLLSKSGADLGINFRYDLIKRIPNTRNSHRLIRFAINYNKEIEAIESLFRAYFVMGLDIGDPHVIYNLAKEMNLPIKDFLNDHFSKEDLDKSLKYSQQIYNKGINV